MTRLLVAIMLAIVSCAEPHRPFQSESWSQFPSDDELVRALVGQGGTQIERLLADRVSREVLVPRLKDEFSTVADLRSELELLSRQYERHAEGRHPMPFLWIAMRRELEYLYMDAVGHVAVQLHQELWPYLPVAEAWRPLVARAGRSSIEAVKKRYYALQDEYEDLFDDVFDFLGPPRESPDTELFRRAAMVRNCFYILHSGKYWVTTGVITDVLIERRVFTTRLEADL